MNPATPAYNGIIFNHNMTAKRRMGTHNKPVSNITVMRYMTVCQYVVIVSYYGKTAVSSCKMRSCVFPKNVSVANLKASASPFVF